MEGFALLSPVRDEDGRIVDFRYDHVNRTGCALAGRSRAEHIGQRFTTLHPGLRSSGLIEDLRRMMETGEPVVRESLYYEGSAGGEAPWRVLELRASRLEGGCAFTWRDVTERLRVLEALRESERRQRALLDAIPDRMFLLFPDGRCLDFRALGIGEAVLSAGRGERGHRPQELGGLGEGEIRQVLAAGEAQAFTYEVDLEGETRTLEARLAPAGEDRVLALVRDVTREVQLQRRIERAQKIEALGQLAGSIAHDFNNLLMAVIGTAELCQRDLPPDHGARDGLAAILRTAHRGAELTGGLLGFARRQPLERRDFQVDDLVREMLPLLRRLIPEHIRIEHHAAGEPLVVSVDPNRFQQVLLNLCVNARDAMPSGGLLTVAVEPFEIREAFLEDHPYATAGRYVMVAVTDTGVGMDPKTRARVFEPFFTTKTEGRGTGIGLSTAYGIVKQHGGIVEVESELGKGSTFRALFPASDRPGATFTPWEVSASVEGGSERLLVVEDDPEVRKVLALALSSLGYDVLEAGNGRQALDLLQGTEVDLIVSDAVMPELGGAELLAVVRERFPDLPFLFSSGYSETTIADLVTDTPGVGLLAKPYTVDDLARKVRSLLDGGSGAV